MALPVTVYRWDDVGAPQVVDGKPSEYMNVFKKCLVEGYGSKASLGWTIETDITSPPALALKNNAAVGSGGVVIFTAANDDAGAKTTVRAVQDYIDINTYSRSSPFSAFDRNSSSSYMLNKWFIFGTGKAFYFFTYSEYSMAINAVGTRSCGSFFVGDFNSLYPNDSATFIHMAGVRDSTSTSWSHSLIYKISDTSMRELTDVYPLDGANTPSPVSVYSIFGNVAYTSGHQNDPRNPTILAPCYLMMGSGQIQDSSIYQNTINPFVRGLLPGMYVANTAGYRQTPAPVIEQLNNVAHYLIPSSNSHTGCAWINLEEW
jgi:hypothetical protein